MAATIILALSDPQATYLESTATAATDITIPFGPAVVPSVYTTEVIASSVTAGCIVNLEGSMHGISSSPWTVIQGVMLNSSQTGNSESTVAMPWKFIRHNFATAISSNAGFLTIRTLGINGRG